jgi:hypothetical protein
MLLPWINLPSLVGWIDEEILWNCVAIHAGAGAGGGGGGGGAGFGIDWLVGHCRLSLEQSAQKDGDPCGLHSGYGDSLKTINLMSVSERVDGRCPIKKNGRRLSLRNENEGILLYFQAEHR